MENASKALVIAGAVLLSILLISIGILIFNSTGTVTDQVKSQSESMAIQTFNSQFTPYEGSGKTASEIRSLKSAVNASNAINTNNKVTINPPTLTIMNNKKYTVIIEYDPLGSGYIKTIHISTPATL